MIHIQDVCVELPGFCVQDVNLHIQPGEFFTLIGPTGSGKTVLLENLAGLVPATRGRIRISGRDVTALPPEKRAVSLVYQDHSLFPHLTVLENVAYGQRYQDIDAETGRKEAFQLLDRLGLVQHAHRKPLTLSGGEKQRVSIARALACHPKLLLLDEPLSALDPQFKAGLRQELKALHRDTGLTVLMVTHDFLDAFTLADRAGVMHNGRLEQVGTVKEIFRRPATPFVAEFVGMAKILFATFQENQSLFTEQAAS
ncbi:tungstate/molybdate transport system ATP-binding protein [Humidesulfovibrio mexicanus]|uniref:Tungstate/molybdate transport system ATP-binding protein n=1 Tax=Humidesulfovibrio mexicanus TaxID=147047 RepID=A0A239A734_9BACT|nr:ATP-binding cassette domain-containing protein [Humidesulfovibrio mexicanus]SNR90898.1 tungstate/molybdate transport system ATP-binding protein [Humidesulfovibrio mexicanus]